MASSSTRTTAFERKILRLYTLAWCCLRAGDPHAESHMYTWIDLVKQFREFIDLDCYELLRRSYDTMSRPAIRSFGLFEDRTENERFWDDATAESAKPHRVCERLWFVSNCVLDASNEMMRTGRRADAIKFEELSREWKLMGDKALEKEEESRKEEP